MLDSPSADCPTPTATRAVNDPRSAAPQEIHLGVAQRTQENPPLSCVRSPLRVQHDRLIATERSLGQIAQRNPLSGGYVKCVEFSARPDVDDPQSRTPFLDPLRELD